MEFTLKKFVNEFNNRKVYYDPTFQRRVVWKPENINKYFYSLTKGWTVTPIVVLEIESCIEHSETVGDQASVEYYNSIRSKGYKYISLDGQNRTKHIEKVLSNLITITGEFFDGHGEKYTVVNKYLKDIDDKLHLHITRVCTTPVRIMTEATRSEACEIFRHLNDGEPLNEQEKRNSIATPIAEEVRTISKQRKGASEKMFHDKDICRMVDDETYAKMLMTLIRKYRINGELKHKNYGLSKSEIDEFYKMGEGYYNIEDNNCPYIKEEIERAKEIIRSFATVLLLQELVTAPSLKIARRYWWAVLYACTYAHDNNYKIQDHNEFYIQLKAIDDRLAMESESAYMKRREELIASNSDFTSIPKTEYYHKWQNLPHIFGDRQRRIKAIHKEMEKSAAKSKLTLRLKPLIVKKAA